MKVFGYEYDELNKDYFEDTNPMVSVWCITYNHIGYIRDALDGFLMQQTDFSLEVVIVDDASTDGTSDILKMYAKQHPEIFHVFIAKKNTFRSPLRTDIYTYIKNKYLKGKYVAWCEGDDCWIDPDKLQLQVDYLEEHPQCVMTAHSTIWENCRKKETCEYRPYSESRVLAQEEIIMQYGGNLSTASLVMRRDAISFDDRFPDCDVGDYPLQLNAILKGEVYYFDREMSVYRYMHQNSWSRNVLGNFEKKILHFIGMSEFLEKYDIYTDFKFHGFIRKKQVQYLYSSVISHQHMTCKSYREKCKCLPVKSERWQEYCIRKQCRIFEIIKQEYCFSIQEREYLLSYKFIVIMGNGQFATYIGAILKNNHISFCGNIVTKISNNERNEKNLWELSNYPYNHDQTLVIIGISQENEKEITDSLRHYNYNHIFTPMWFDFNEMGEIKK